MYDLGPELKPDRRWRVKITYRDGSTARVVMVEEIHELQGIVEHGPDWNTIDCIKIKLNRRSDAIPTLSPEDLDRRRRMIKRR